MMEKISDRYDFVCDSCGTVLETNTGDYDDAILVMHSEKWNSFQVEGQWKHLCSKCDLITR